MLLVSCTQNTRLCNIHTVPSWSPFSGPQVGTGSILFCVCHVIMCIRAPVSYEERSSFPHLFTSALRRKQPDISQKGCLSPFHNIWQDWISPLVFNLQRHVIFSLFNSSLTCFISSLAVRDLEIQYCKISRQLWVTAPNPSFEPQLESQTIIGRWEICIGIWAPVSMATATVAAVSVLSHLLYYMTRKLARHMGL